MAGPRKTATTTAMTTLREAVAREAREAALARWTTPPDVFVWRARRCAEALLYCVLAREGANVDELARQRKGLDQLFEHKQLEGVFSRETRAQLATLREFGNIAAHYQLEGGVSAESADGVARHLAGLLREFYALDGGAVPEAQRAYLAALTDASSRVLTPGEAEVATARRERDDVTRQLNAARAEHGASHPAAASPALRRGLLAGAALVLAALAFKAGRVTTPPLSLTTAHLDAPPVAPPVPPTPVPLDRPVPRAPAPAEPSAPAAPLTPVARPRSPSPPVVAAPSCTLSQRSARADGRPFCIDAEYVSTREYRGCVDRGGCSRPVPGVGCNWQNGPDFDGNAANCVTREQAIAYCATRPEGAASLPTRAELRAMRGRGDLVVRDDTDEWTADDAPAGRAWTRGPRAAADFAWTGVPPTRRSRGLGFRCVTR